MFSGGIAYNRKLVLTNAVREGSRYGATLPVAAAPCSSGVPINCWLAQVAEVTQKASEGELSSASGWKVCVAYVPAAADAGDKRRKLERTPASPDFFTTVPPSTLPAATCFDDGLQDTDRRVQVTAEKAGKLQYLVSSTNLTLQSRAVTRFEAPT